MSTGSEELIEVRYIVQKVLMPIIFVIGLIGNSITVLVLTRKPMRCSTNVYLTALAIVDMFYLTMAFLLTLRHFNSIHYHPAYWQCIGLIIWLNDGFSYISIYIAVSFTIERYIAVRYPIRRKTYCTEALAKKVICGIVIFCLATTISTAFEYEVNTKSNCETKNEIPSNSNSTNEDVFVGRHLEDYNEQQNDTLNLTSISAISTNILLNQKDCPKPFYYDVTESIFGSNENYRNIFFVYTMIFFVIIPLIILVTFNTFLVILVRQSKLIRSQMTQKSIRTNESVRRPNLSIKFNKNATISQENKITIVLIAVVIVFVICQLPWSIFMIYNQYVNMPIYLSLVFGNIGNLLVAINAASNFFLYCLLSDKYRKTVKDIIMGRNKHKRKDLSYHIRKDPLSWSSHNKHNITTSNINNKNSTYHDLATEKLILNNNNNCQQQITNNNNNLSLNKNEFLKLPSTNRKYPRLLQHSISLTSSFNNTHQFNDDINNRQYQQQHHHHHLLQQDSLKHSKYCPLYRIRSKNIRNNNHNHQYSIGLNDNSISSWIPYKIRNQFIKLNNNKYNDNIQEISVNTTDTDNNNDEDNNNSNNNNNSNTISIKRSQSLTLIPKTRHSPCCKDYLE